MTLPSPCAGLMSFGVLLMRDPSWTSRAFPPLTVTEPPEGGADPRVTVPSGLTVIGSRPSSARPST